VSDCASGTDNDETDFFACDVNVINVIVVGHACMRSLADRRMVASCRVFSYTCLECMNDCVKCDSVSVWPAHVPYCANKCVIVCYKGRHCEPTGIGTENCNCVIIKACELK